ncbi:MAG: hypothetical protein HQK95_02170 [Nitrospirae bacterium]|nr:hypothetical protein [Nitrospirota bacterium]
MTGHIVTESGISSGIVGKTIKNTITLALKGENITSDKLRDSISAFYDFIDEVSAQVSGTMKPVKWIVTVKHGSILLLNNPVVKEEYIDVIEKTVDALHYGITNLENKTERPAYFTDKALELLQNLVSVSSARGDELTEINIAINGDYHVLTTRIAANIDTIMGIRYKSLGSVEGKLQTISERGGLKFTIYDTLDDRPVRCYISDDLRSEALDVAAKAFGQRISIFGMISYDQYGTPKIIQVRKLRLFREKEDIPSAEQICGILGE